MAKNCDFTEKFCTLLRANDLTLTSLNFHNTNRIGDAGAVEALAAALHTNTILTFLYIICNNIGASGARFLATALQMNNTLTDLVLSNNNIGDAGAEALATALQTNIALNVLNLYGNNISATGAEALCTALHNNTTLTLLDIDGNIKTSTSLRDRIEQFLRRNKALRTLEFWSPLRCASFSCRNLIMASLLCNNEFSGCLPLHIWTFIFSFLQRLHLPYLCK